MSIRKAPSSSTYIFIFFVFRAAPDPEKGASDFPHRTVTIEAGKLDLEPTHINATTTQGFAYVAAT